MNLSSAAPKRLVLGAAGLGMAYGRPDQRGQAPSAPNITEVRAILQAAWELGIRVVDTAPAYGNSEPLIGAHWSGEVWTKTGFDENRDASLQRLNRDAVALMQWHNWSPKLFAEPAFIEAWQQLIDDPRCTKLGVSVYTEAEARAALDLPHLRVLQLPWNILDQQPVAAIAAEAHARGVEIAARSVYLQGLLAGRQLPTAAQQLAPVLGEIVQAAESAGLSMPAYALRAALDCPHLDWILIGCDRVEQVAVIAEALAAQPLANGEVVAWCQRQTAALALDPRTW